MVRWISLLFVLLLAAVTIWLAFKPEPPPQKVSYLSAAGWQDLRRDMLRVHAQASEHDVQAFIRRCRGGAGQPTKRSTNSPDDECWISYGLQLTQRVQDVRGRLTPVFQKIAASSTCGRALRSYNEALRTLDLVTTLPTYRQAAPALDEARDTLDPFLAGREPAGLLQSCAPRG